jgi:opacity protein-like surface antigen
MKKSILVAIVILAALIATAYASDNMKYIKGANHFDCVNKEDFKKLVGYAVDGDTAAFEKELSYELLMGMATTFKDGESVYLEDTDIWSGLVQVRPAGETQAYWTNIEAVS